jgi:hypothetical protein
MVENVLMTSEQMQHTLSLLEQVAQMYAIYDNAVDMYESLGTTAASITRMSNGLPGVVSTWTENAVPEDIYHGQSQLDRWGVEATDHGVLANLNASLFGTSSATGTLAEGMADAARFARNANGQFRRDTTIRRLIRGLPEVDATDTPTISVGGGELDMVQAADGSLETTITKNVGDETVTIGATEVHMAEAAAKAADMSMLDANAERLMIQQNSQLNQDMTEKLIDYESQDVDLTKLYHDRLAISVQKLKQVNNLMDTKSVTENSEMDVSTAYWSMYRSRNQQGVSSANAAAAINQ